MMATMKNPVTVILDHHLSHATLFSKFSRTQPHDKTSHDATDTSRTSFVTVTSVLDKNTINPATVNHDLLVTAPINMAKTKNPSPTKIYVDVVCPRLPQICPFTPRCDYLSLSINKKRTRSDLTFVNYP